MLILNHVIIDKSLICNVLSTLFIDLWWKHQIMHINPRTITSMAAVDSVMAIGSDGNIPWMGKMRADIQLFINFTLNKSVIMGRKTFESIGKPLNNRVNIVLTRDKSFSFKGILVAHSIDEAIALAGNGDIVVIGGGEIYKAFMGIVDQLIITHVDTKIVDADAFFPPINPDDWQLLKEHKHEVCEKNIYPCRFAYYERNHD